jgi:hypothetical protein
LEPSPAGRSFERSICLFPAVVHALLAVHNTHIQPAPASQNNVPPELQPDHGISQ